MQIHPEIGAGVEYLSFSLPSFDHSSTILCCCSAALILAKTLVQYQSHTVHVSVTVLSMYRYFLIIVFVLPLFPLIKKMKTKMKRTSVLNTQVSSCQMSENC